MGNSTLTMGWIQKSNFTLDDKNDTNTIKNLTAAHHLARIFQQSLSCLYTQWFRSKDNNVSDSLLWYHHLSTSFFTDHLSSSIPHWLPSDFKIANKNLEN